MQEVMSSHTMYYTKQSNTQDARENRGNIKKERSENNGHDEEKALPRTSVVLLLLVVIAEFPFTLCRHPTLCLHHLLYFIGTVLESLRRVEALVVGGWGRAPSNSLIEW